MRKLRREVTGRSTGSQVRVVKLNTGQYCKVIILLLSLIRKVLDKEM